MEHSSRIWSGFFVACLLLQHLQLAHGGRVGANARLLTSARELVVSPDGGALQAVVPGGTEEQRAEARAALQEAGATTGGEVEPSRPSRCPGECTKYGTCNEELARCDCPIGRNGTDCSSEVPASEMPALCSRFGHTSATCTRAGDYASCVNGCNFRGRCVGGFCHCKPGHYGADCSLSLADGQAAGTASGSAAGSPPGPLKSELLAGQNYTVRPSGPRIYVYELPPELSVYPNLDRLDRPLMYLLWQRFLSAGLRVADPAQADFFFVPVRVRLQFDSGRVTDAVRYISQTWPYWNATGGDRHIFVHVGDWGRDELTDDAVLLTRNSTWLTHWGLARDHEFAGWKAAHRPGRDIVLPLVLQASLLSAYKMAQQSPLHPTAPKRYRKKTLFFAGRVCGSRAQPSTNGSFPNCPDVLGKEDAYSAATRQRTFFHHHNRTNWKVVTKSKTYGLDMMTSRFCLAPSGGGQGKRSVISVLMGCVPVTVTDGLLQPFDPELRWDRFSIDVRERDIPVMHEMLDGLSKQQTQEFQSNLRCAAQHLFWSSVYGSLFGEDGRYDAFETLVQILRMRATYPNLGPEEYSYVDHAFAAFMACKEPAELAASRAGSAAAGASAPGNGTATAGAFGAGQRAAGKGGSAGGILDIAKPGLAESLTRTALPAPVVRIRPDPTKQELCTHSLYPNTPGMACSRCVRRRGRLLNPGGTICCNQKELGKCPRLWD